MNTINWKDKERYPIMNISCHCGGMFRGAVHFDYNANRGDRILSENPCPICGKNNNIYKVASDKENFTLG